MREETTDELLVGSSPRRYICEVHREIYDLMEKHISDREVLENGLNLVAEAYWSGKRMNDRLKELSPNGRFEEFWPVNEDYETDLSRRAERIGLLRNIKSINIETIDYCNRKCDWCPNKDRETSPDRLMPMEVYARIIRQLVDFGYTGDIHPFLNGEPMLDSRIVTLLKMTKSLLPNNYVRIVTNGANMRLDVVEALFKTGLDSIHFNHYDDHLKDITKAGDISFPKMTHFGLPALLPTFYNRGGKVNYEPKHRAKNGQCHNFLNKLVFNYRGEMILCCSDFNSEVVFGNIMEKPLSIILSSKKYREYYYAHREGRGKEMFMCRECNII